MIFEYAVFSTNHLSRDYIPKYRRKLTGILSIFQFLYEWKVCKTFMIDSSGNPWARGHMVFKDFDIAHTWLKDTFLIRTPYEYEKEVEDSYEELNNKKIGYFQKKY